MKPLGKRTTKFLILWVSLLGVCSFVDGAEEYLYHYIIRVESDLLATTVWLTIIICATMIILGLLKRKKG